MLRRFVEEFGLFLLPFGLFFAYLLLVGRNPLQRAHWDAQAFRLVLAGLAVVIASMVASGLFSERHAAGFVPTHMENGRLVPGEFR
ncbi:DUF6111 family protein [Methylobacterium sp. E-041]|jgi:hypothetical protein|uniref:DUF6111 family protein n=1 Tax=unclassified Methylobacterium TaxID=2615210 RepID=UPI0011CA6C70|nr:MULTISPECIES: DUF6111 family protein [unclassified Methylobacterium]RZK81451.1 MAG: hypothetical protein EOO66_28560 [Methylobacterium sp.]MCJ2008730.1 DUF6111 family protein [Methylobacterium sp. J-092]MCJ2042022.1 DUF6111 family protein [Methylobacterium sp. J-059]MCJ2074855.1 DUF6111 family protein [Methylobacterium sp. E-016]MCJ2105285.1 DUF6111 family protein [Methylobacterium sp. E-041]